MMYKSQIAIDILYDRLKVETRQFQTSKEQLQILLMTGQSYKLQKTCGTSVTAKHYMIP